MGQLSQAGLYPALMDNYWHNEVRRITLETHKQGLEEPEWYPLGMIEKLGIIFLVSSKALLVCSVLYVCELIVAIASRPRLRSLLLIRIRMAWLKLKLLFNLAWCTVMAMG